LRLFLETVIKSKPWDFDYTALAMPWQEVSKKESLTIGVLVECPTWPVAPTIKRAVTTAAEKLKEAGHKIVTLDKFPSFKEATELSWSFFDIDNEGTGFKHIEASGEPWVTSVKDMYTPPPEGRKDKSLADLFEMNQKFLKFRAEWLKVFMENKLDVIVAPGAHQTAVLHDTFRWPPYTVMWNLLAVSWSCLGALQCCTTNADWDCSILLASSPISRPTRALTSQIQRFRIVSWRRGMGDHGRADIS
jgi:amidase